MSRKVYHLVFYVVSSLGLALFLCFSLNKSYAMHKKEAPSDEPVQETFLYKISQKGSESKIQEKFLMSSQEPMLNKDFLSQLPTQFILSIINYLDYKEHFQLAQTSRQHLFLWGAVTRVGSDFVLESSPSKETVFSWDDEWPKQITSSLAIEVKRNLKKEELVRLLSLREIGAVSHLRFYTTQEGITTDVVEFLRSQAKELLPTNLVSLTFEKVAPLHQSGCYGSGLANLHQIILKGQIAEEPRDNISNFIRALVGFRKTLQYISFENPSLSPEEITSLFRGINASSDEYIRTIEIKEEGTSYDYLFALNDFRLKPLIIHDQGIRITHKRREHQLLVIPGSARLQHVILNQGVDQERLPFHRLFSKLSESGVPLRELFPLLRTRTTKRRAELLAHILEGNALVVQEGSTITIDNSKIRSLDDVKPNQFQENLQDVHIRVAAFSRSPEIMKVSLKDLLEVLKTQGKHNRRAQILLEEQKGIQKEERFYLLRWIQDVLRCFEAQEIEAEELLYSPLELVSIDEKKIKVAAFRNSRRVIEMKIEDLLNLIREQGKYNDSVQHLLRRIPDHRNHSKLLHWFRQVLEFFEDGENKEQDRSESNDAEILLGTSLMKALKLALNHK